MNHIFSADEQKWIDSNFMPKIISSKLEKIAIIKSEDLYVEMATDMMMQQDSAKELRTMFFKSKEEAESWLSS